MTMIEFFNFLEDNDARIVNLTRNRLRKANPALKHFSGATLKSLLAQYLDGYIDLLVTDQTDVVDRTLGILSHLLAAGGERVIGLLDIPLTMEAVIRRYLANEYAAPGVPDAVHKFNEALEQAETTSCRCACRLLDVYQRQAGTPVDERDGCLEEMQNEFGIDLAEFRSTPRQVQPGK